MFKVGDIVKIIDKEFIGQSFEVFQLQSSPFDRDILLGLRNIKTSDLEIYYKYTLELDEKYYRKEKIKKICSKLEIK